MTVSNLPELEYLYFGSGSFYHINSFTLSHNPNLKIFETGDGYKSITAIYGCSFSNIKSLVLFGKSIMIFNNNEIYLISMKLLLVWDPFCIYHLLVLTVFLCLMY